MRSQQLAAIAAEMTQPQRPRAARRCRRCSTATAIPMASRSPAPAIPRRCAQLTPRRARRLPPDLDPARQCDDLRRRRPPLPQLMPLLEAQLRQLARARGGPRRQDLHRADRRRRAADRADRPAAIAAVADPRRPDAAGRGHATTCSTSTPPTRCSAATSCRGINMDLRETKHWSYGARGSFTSRVEHQVPYIIHAPVQADQTGASIAAAREDVAGFLTDERRHRRGAEPHHQRQHPPAARPVRDVGRGARRRCAPTRSTTGPTIIATTIADRYRAMTAAIARPDRAALHQPEQFRLGGGRRRGRVRPQLERLGLPIEVVRPALTRSGRRPRRETGGLSVRAVG